MVKHAAFYSTDRHLELRLKPYQTPFTSPHEHLLFISRLSSASFPRTGSWLWSHAHAAGGGEGPLKGSWSSRLSPNCIKDGVQYPRPTPLLSSVNLSQQAWISSFPERPGHYMNKRRGQRGDLTSSYRGGGFDTTNAADKCTLSL